MIETWTDKLEDVHPRREVQGDVQKFHIIAVLRRVNDIRKWRREHKIGRMQAHGRGSIIQGAERI